MRIHNETLCHLPNRIRYKNWRSLLRDPDLGHGSRPCKPSEHPLKMIRKYSLQGVHHIVFHDLCLPQSISFLLTSLKIASFHPESRQNIQTPSNIPTQNTDPKHRGAFCVAPDRRGSGTRPSSRTPCGNGPAHGRPTWPRHRTWRDCGRDPGPFGR